MTESTVNQRIVKTLRSYRVRTDMAYSEFTDGFYSEDEWLKAREKLEAEATAQLCKLISNEVINARIDEQVRTRLSSVQRDTIVVHLPDSVISQHDRVKQLASKEEQEKI